MKMKKAIIKKTPYLFNHIINPNTTICRYMDLDKFLPLLEGHFYVPRKLNFPDSGESGKIPPKFWFGFSCVNEKWERQSEMVSKRQERRNRYIKSLLESRLLLTSCWIIDNGEDYLMWNSYARKLGVCLRTTIADLMYSLDYDKENYLPICSPIFYEKINYNEDLLESIFKKEPYYQSENEVRFYFVPKDNIPSCAIEDFNNVDVEKILKETAKNEEKKYKESQKSHSKYDLYKIFEIKPEFINSIILSPLILKGSEKIIKDILLGQYGSVFKNKSMIESSKISLEL